MITTSADPQIVKNKAREEDYQVTIVNITFSSLIHNNTTAFSTLKILLGAKLLEVVEHKYLLPQLEFY